MFRSLITAGVAAVVLVAGAPFVAADPGAYYADGYTALVKGTGAVSGFVAADPFGRMTAESAATGGSKKGLFGSSTRPSSADAVAYVTDAVAGSQTGEGRYRVTITYSGAYATEAARGTGQARGSVVGTVFIDEAAIGYASAELPGTAQQVVLRIDFNANFIGTPEVAVQAELDAASDATGKNNGADTEAYTSGVTFSLDKIG